MTNSAYETIKQIATTNTIPIINAFLEIPMIVYFSWKVLKINLLAPNLWAIQAYFFIAFLSFELNNVSDGWDLGSSQATSFLGDVFSFLHRPEISWFCGFCYDRIGKPFQFYHILETVSIWIFCLIIAWYQINSINSAVTSRFTVPGVAWVWPKKYADP